MFERLHGRRLFSRVGALAAGALLLWAGAAGATKISGSIAGYIYLENPVWSEAKDPKLKGYTFREIVPTVPAGFRRLYPQITKEICVALLARDTQTPKAPVTVRVGGGRTSPVTLVVAPGTKVIFENTDPFTHRLYGVGMKEFAASETAKGSKREWSVPAAGIYEIRDELAPSVRMWVVSEPQVSSITYPTLKGDYVLQSETPGDYVVQAYFSGRKIGNAMPVTVGAADVAVEAIAVGKKPEGKPE